MQIVTVALYSIAAIARGVRMLRRLALPAFAASLCLLTAGALVSQARVRDEPAPDLLGRSIEATQAWATTRNLPVIVDKSIPTRGEVPGYILSQTPRPGVNLGFDQTVHVTVTGVVRVKTIPAETGQKAEDAWADLRYHGYRPDTDFVDDAAAPPGTVLRQSPSENVTAPPGTVVTLFVSDGPGRVQVPSLKGLSQVDAQNRMRSLGVEMGVRGVTFDTTVPAGSIIKSNPPAGSLLPAHGRVVVVLSAGPAPAHEVPNLVGLRLDTARQTAAAAGFDLRVSNSTSPGGYFVVTSQDVPDGSPLTPNCKMDVQGRTLVQPIPLAVEVSQASEGTAVDQMP